MKEGRLRCGRRPFAWSDGGYGGGGGAGGATRAGPVRVGAVPGGGRRIGGRRGAGGPPPDRFGRSVLHPFRGRRWREHYRDVRPFRRRRASGGRGRPRPYGAWGGGGFSSSGTDDQATRVRA